MEARPQVFSSRSPSCSNGAWKQGLANGYAAPKAGTAMESGESLPQILVESAGRCDEPRRQKEEKKSIRKVGKRERRPRKGSSSVKQSRKKKSQDQAKVPKALGVLATLSQSTRRKISRSIQRENSKPAERTWSMPKNSSMLPSLSRQSQFGKSSLSNSSSTRPARSILNTWQNVSGSGKALPKSLPRFLSRKKVMIEDRPHELRGVLQKKIQTEEACLQPQLAVLKMPGKMISRQLKLRSKRRRKKQKRLREMRSSERNFRKSCMTTRRKCKHWYTL